MSFSKIFSRFSRGDKAKTSVPSGEEVIGEKGRVLSCKILFLDDTDLLLYIKVKSNPPQSIFVKQFLLVKFYFRPAPKVNNY